MNGIDYASEDANATPNVAALKAAGIQFVYLRKSYPLWDMQHKAWHLAPDKTYEIHAPILRAAGIRVGAYGFWTFSVGAPSPAEQVANFVAAPGGIEPGDLPPASDIEFPGNGVADTGRTQAECFALVQQFHDELIRQTGRSTVVTYTSHVEWHDTNGLGGPAWPGAVDSPLWDKTPYPVGAGKPLATAFRLPHVGPAADDLADLWRVPTPWADAGWWFVQQQGDVRSTALGTSLGVGQADADLFVGCCAGDSGGKVQFVQKRVGATIDGRYGPATKAAVEAFQVKSGLAQTGVVDLDTFIALCR